MKYKGGEQHLNPDAPLPHHQSPGTDHVDASASPLLPIQNYLGLAKTPLPTEAQLASALKHHEWERRVQAIRQLEHLQEPAALTSLVSALEDEHQAVRAAAARALGAFNTFAP